MKKIYDLEIELKKIIENATEDFEPITREGSPRTPQIIIGPVPIEEPEELVPVIGILASSGRNSLDSKEINLETSIVLFIDDTEETYKMLYEMIDSISCEVLSRGIYLNEFEICTDMTWELNNSGTYMAANILFKFIRVKTYRSDVDNWINGRE